MAAFRFRLQKLLDLALTQQRARAQELGVARASEQGAAVELDHSRERRLSHLDDLRQAPSDGRLDLDSWLAGRARYQGMRVDETAAAARLGMAQQEVSAAQGAFVEARREGAVLERLRDRREHGWRAGQAAADQAVLDEVAGRVGGDAGKGRA